MAKTWQKQVSDFWFNSQDALLAAALGFRLVGLHAHAAVATANAQCCRDIGVAFKTA